MFTTISTFFQMHQHDLTYIDNTHALDLFLSKIYISILVILLLVTLSSPKCKRSNFAVSFCGKFPSHSINFRCTVTYRNLPTYYINNKPINFGHLLRPYSLIFLAYKFLKTNYRFNFSYNSSPIKTGPL